MDDFQPYVVVSDFETILNGALCSSSATIPSQFARSGDASSRVSNSLSDGVYHIVNVSTGAFVALLSDHDRSEVVNITYGLEDDSDYLGTQVILRLGEDRLWLSTG